MSRNAQTVKSLVEVALGESAYPMLPETVLRISRMSVSPQTNATDIGRLISDDSELTRKTLALVNSSFYGFPREISRVTKAIVLIGFNKVRSMAVAVSVVDLFRDAAVDGFVFKEFWQHAVATAIAGDLLARRVCPQRADDAFLAGLLSEIGKALFAKLAPEAYGPLLKQAQTTQHDLVALEREAAGVTFPEAGSRLLSAWRFPENLALAVNHFRDPGASQDDRLLPDLVHVASALASALGFMGAGESVVMPLCAGSWRNLKLSEELIYEVQSEFLRAWPTAGDLLELVP